MRTARRSGGWILGGRLGRAAAAAALALFVLPACRQRTVLDPRTLDPFPTRPQPVCEQPARPGLVRLTARDLAPVDAFIHVRPTRWILGDRVDVVASREYFGSQITVASRIGMVRRQDRTTRDETIVTLTFIGSEMVSGVERNPRVVIGTGITVTARHELVLHLVRTRDALVPVRLVVTAVGNAAEGHQEVVDARAPELQLGGSLVATRAGMRWNPIR